jgi:hypothetical protein
METTCTVGPKVLEHPVNKSISPHPRIDPNNPSTANTTRIGSTAHVDVLLDNDLDPVKGVALARQILATVEAAYLQNASYYNLSTLKRCTCVVAKMSAASDGSGGAEHLGCDFASGGVLFCDADFSDPRTTLGLFIAELDECFQGDASNPNRGWDCGGSGGEAHSRAAAELASGGASGSLKDYTSAPSWVQAGKPNWIDRDQGTDRDYPSIGCGMIYLSWMGKRYTFAQITQAGGATLAQNYAKLTGRSASSAWSDFMAAVTTLTSITTDDPFNSNFGGSGSPAPPPPPASWPNYVGTATGTIKLFGMSVPVNLALKLSPQAPGFGITFPPIGDVLALLGDILTRNGPKFFTDLEKLLADLGVRLPVA